MHSLDILNSWSDLMYPDVYTSVLPYIWKARRSRAADPSDPIVQLSSRTQVSTLLSANCFQTCSDTSTSICLELLSLQKHFEKVPVQSSALCSLMPTTLKHPSEIHN